LLASSLFKHHTSKYCTTLYLLNAMIYTVVRELLDEIHLVLVVSWYDITLV